MKTCVGMDTWAVASSRSRGSELGSRSSDEPESLPSRIYWTFDEVPRNGQLERGTSKCFGHALHLLNTCTHQKTAALNST